MNIVAGIDDKSGDDAVGKNAVMILKFEDIFWESGVLWFVFRQNGRDKKFRWVAIDGKAKLEFLH